MTETTVETGGATGSRVLVVGGHGAVGSAVVAALDGWLPGRVLAGGRGRGVRVDVTDPEAFGRTLGELGEGPAPLGAVVMCVEPPDSGAARACLERGVGVVDVGATPALLDGVAGLDGVARRAGATAVLSVGVAPGLTNLLARRAHEAVGGAERIDLTVLLGAGERHGADAVRWTVEGLAEPVTAAPGRYALPGYGRRAAHPFPFADQYVLRRTLGVPEVTTRLALDSRALTAALFTLRRTGAARPPAVRRLLTALFRRVHTGGDGFALRAEAVRGEQRVALALAGRVQSRVTGLVAAHAARALLDGALPSGVHHLEGLPALADLPERLGLTVVREARGPEVREVR
ncbi:saccharopine dehydrogenase [Streptomyces sp. NPDC046887]|uniref:saccharopine dehydrogenase n=1 Tax=Streptomyces sp. NPDC046887 TaxID=3155472 RepID=UPI0033E65F34